MAKSIHAKEAAARDKEGKDKKPEDNIIKMLIKPKLKITFGQIACLLISLFLFAYPVITDVMTNHRSDELITTYTQHVQANPEENKRLLAEAQAYNDRLSNTPNDYEGKIPPEYELIAGLDLPFAWIEIPRLDQKIPIYHGTSYESLQAGVGHMERTSIPVGGVSTHAVLTAHSGMRGSRMFDDIPKMENGDIILIHILNDTLAYEVYGHDIVLPYETSSLKIQKGRDLVSLVTCYPYGVNTHRYILHAERTDYDPTKAIPSNTGSFLNNRTYPLLFALLVLTILLFLWWKMRPREIGHKARKLKRLVRHDKLPDPSLIPRETVWAYKWGDYGTGYNDRKCWIEQFYVRPDDQEMPKYSKRGIEVEWHGDKRKKVADWQSSFTEEDNPVSRWIEKRRALDANPANVMMEDEFDEAEFLSMLTDDD